MIIRITRILLLLQLIVAAGIATTLVETQNIHPVIGTLAGIAVVIFVRMLITANNFRLAWRFRSETPAAFRLGWRQACRMFFGEFRATMISSSVTMPFQPFAMRHAGEARGLPVLLVHGYGCNSGYWHSMSKALMQAHISHLAFDMEPVFGGIDDYVPAIQEAVEKLRRETGKDRIVILAHSMGGLAARAYLRKHGTSRIAKVITLGTPHRGTGIALSGIGQNCRQMHWAADGEDGVSSDWLRELAKHETTQAPDFYSHFVSIYSHHDNIISPQTSSHLHGAVNIEYHGIGHVALAMAPEIQKHVVAEVLATSDTHSGLAGFSK